MTVKKNNKRTKKSGKRIRLSPYIKERSDMEVSGLIVVIEKPSSLRHRVMEASAAHALVLGAYSVGEIAFRYLFR